jgi:anti-sigma factor RsiW
MHPCQRFKESLLNFFDDELDIHQKKEVEKHLKECHHCALFLNRMRRLRSHLTGLTPMKASENFHILIRERIRREVARKRSGVTSTIIIRRWIPAFGLTVLIAVVGYWILDQNTTVFHPASDVRPSSVSSENFDGQIQYVIDDYPDRLSVSREDEESRDSYVSGDTIRSEEDRERIQTHITPVSF